MTTTEAHADLFGPPKSAPKSLRDAAAILGAYSPPREALREAAETLWIAGLTRRSGAGQGTILRSVAALTFAVFDHPDSEVSPRHAARSATVRLAAHMQADQDAQAANPGNGGEPRS